MDFLKKYRFEIDAALADFFKKYERADVIQKDFSRAIRHAALLGGKRIRPILGMLAFEISANPKTKISRQKAIQNLLSIEFVHASSLVHDDLPALDDDILRRGRPTVWKKFGEALAILAGDALAVLAFENLVMNAPDFALRKLTKILAECAGARGMIGGQARDLQPEKISSLRNLTEMHSQKTGKLILAAAQFGAVLAGADSTKVKRLENFATKIGLAFQISDDLLDARGDEKILGKKVGKDLKVNPRDISGVNIVKFLGSEKSEEKLQKLTREAVAIARDLESKKLEKLAEFVLMREK
ncbi:polyprenyl synthetase family protein [Patescibacteria group bacterium]|nr:polyprenyl synthetase family protein [Patescibacteria group bacterium]